MTDPPVIPDAKPRQTTLLAWAVGATFAALVFAMAAVFYFVRVRDLLARPGASPFLQLQEEAIPGRYKWAERESLT
jgi:hypothetical protein